MEINKNTLSSCYSYYPEFTAKKEGRHPDELTLRSNVRIERGGVWYRIPVVLSGDERNAKSLYGRFINLIFETVNFYPADETLIDELQISEQERRKPIYICQ